MIGVAIIAIVIGVFLFFLHYVRIKEEAVLHEALKHWEQGDIITLNHESEGGELVDFDYWGVRLKQEDCINEYEWGQIEENLSSSLREENERA